MPPRSNESRHVPQISNFPTFVHILVWSIQVEWVIEDQLLQKIERLEIQWGNELTHSSGTYPSLYWLASLQFFSKSSKWTERLLTLALSSPTYNRWNRLEAPESVNTASEEGRRLYVGGLPRFESQEESDAQIRGLFESVGFRPEGTHTNSFSIYMFYSRFQALFEFWRHSCVNLTSLLNNGWLRCSQSLASWFGATNLWDGRKAITTTVLLISNPRRFVDSYYESFNWFQPA
jgi:hypothetical protein